MKTFLPVRDDDMDKGVAGLEYEAMIGMRGEEREAILEPFL